MKTYAIPTNAGQLILLGERMQEGMTKYGQQIPIVLVTATEVGTDTSAFATADAAFNQGRSAQQTASDTYQATLVPLYDWLLAVSNMLASRFGTRWNTEWAQAGFPNHSRAIPQKTPDRMGLALSLVNFFTAKPSYEVPTMDLTAAKGTALRTAVLTAQATLTTAEMWFRKCGDAWQAAYDKLAATMRDLIRNLDSKLADDDTRWLAFGLPMPSTDSTPGQPVNVAAHVDGTGAVIVQCDAVPLALRYRWRVLVVGVDTDYRLADSTTEPMGAVGGIEPGRLVKIIVQAVNGNLQGVASVPIEYRIELPAPKTSVAKGPANVARTTSTAVIGNGNGNGHRHANGNGHELTSRIS